MKAILSTILTISLISSSVIASPSHSAASTPKSGVSAPVTTDFFGKINAHRQQNGVALTWTVANPGDVAGFVIERSWDGFYFDVIDQVEVTDGLNRYRDNDVYPGYLYYRITAVMNDGSQITSAVEMVRIVKNG